jgi:hypothetical protein
MTGPNRKNNKRRRSTEEGAALVAYPPHLYMGQRQWPMSSYMDYTQQNQISKYHDVNCGELRQSDDGILNSDLMCVKIPKILCSISGLSVRMSGKVNKVRVGRFIEVKDIRGITQLVATDDRPHIALKFQSIPVDSYITVVGKCQVRPLNFRNNVWEKTIIFN